MTKLPPLFVLTISILINPFKKLDDIVQLNEYIENVACLSDYSNMFDLLGCKLSNVQLQALESRVETMIQIIQYQINTSPNTTSDMYLELERKEVALIALQDVTRQAKEQLEYLQTQRFIFA
jgi:hypothetical protein